MSYDYQSTWERRRKAQDNAAKLAERIAGLLGPGATVKRCDANTYVTKAGGKRRYRVQQRSVRLQFKNADGPGWTDGRSYTHARVKEILDKAGF